MSQRTVKPPLLINTRPRRMVRFRRDTATEARNGPTSPRKPCFLAAPGGLLCHIVPVRYKTAGAEADRLVHRGSAE